MKLEVYLASCVIGACLSALRETRLCFLAFLFLGLWWWFGAFILPLPHYIASRAFSSRDLSGHVQHYCAPSSINADVSFRWYSSCKCIADTIFALDTQDIWLRRLCGKCAARGCIRPHPMPQTYLHFPGGFLDV